MGVKLWRRVLIPAAASVTVQRKYAGRHSGVLLALIYHGKVVVLAGLRAGVPAGLILNHPDHIFAHGQHIAPPCDVFDQKFADHLVAQRIAQPFDARGACCLFAVRWAAA